MSENVFCGACGFKLSTDDVFCGSCGAKNTNYLESETNDTIEKTNNEDIISNVIIEESASLVGVEAPTKKVLTPIEKARKLNTLIGMSVCAVVLLLIGCVFYYFNFGNGNAQAVANKYMKIYLTYDGEDLLELVHEDILNSYLIQKQTRKSDFEDSVTSSAKYNVDRIAARINASTRKISKSTDIINFYEDTIGVRDVDAIIDKYEDYYSVKKINDVVNYQFELKFEGEDKDIYANHSVTLIKIGTSWYWDFLAHNYSLDF